MRRREGTAERKVHVGTKWRKESRRKREESQWKGRKGGTAIWRKEERN